MRPCRIVAVTWLVTALVVSTAVAVPQAETDQAAPSTPDAPAEADAVERSDPAPSSPVEPAAPTVDATARDDVPEEDDAEPWIVHGDRFVFTGSLSVPANQVRYGDLVAIGGDVQVDGRVRGAVVVIGGDATIRGRVDGDLVAVLSDATLHPGARVDQGVVSVLGDLEDLGARVRGDYVNIPLGLRWPGVEGPFRILLSLWLWTKAIVIVLVFLGIVVLAALAPDRVRRLAEETGRRGVLATLIGIPVFVLGLPVVLLVLTASVVGILVLPVALLAAAALVWLGYAGVFAHVGSRIGRLFRRDLSVLASMLLGYLVFAVIWFVPFVGFLVWIVLTWLASGLLLTGRLGGGPARTASGPAPETAPP